LKGSLLGKVEGEFQNEQYIVQGGDNALSGIFNAIGSGLGAISNVADNSIKSGASYANLMKNSGPWQHRRDMESHQVLGRICLQLSRRTVLWRV
jgi:hypothetical protein